jgi:dihydroorotate dehydrogenase electron transfer subunit
MPPVSPLISTPVQDHTCQVVLNQACGRGLKVLRLKTLSGEFACQPGQFVMLDLPGSRFFFRRPFSVLDVPGPDLIDIYYKVVGYGTAQMAELQPGEAMRCLGPLGIGFSPPQSPETALYIGGGIGIAPLYQLGKSLPVAGHCIYGVRDIAEIGLQAELETVFGERLSIATDNGSAGFHGNVCQLLESQPQLALAAQAAYVCGPTPMMRATVALLHRLNPALRVQVSLEEHMPCGTGACTGCVVPRADQYLPSKVCVEGPVFDARAIRWEKDLLPASAFCGEEGACLS